MSYSPSLCFAPAGVDACAAWRMWMPHLAIPHSRYQFTQGMPPINEMSECDIVVVQRLMTAANIKFFEVARAHGLKICYDLDDLVFNLPASNPAASFFHARESVEGLTACAEWADIITVSTRELKKAVQSKWQHLRNVQTKKEIPVVHIDNCVNFDFFHPPIFPKAKDRVTIGWGGSNTHSGDVGVVWNLLPGILAKYENVYMEFVGQAPPDEIKDHPRVKIRPWVHIAEYAVRFATWNWDIVLAPLEDHKFNHSKSSIKMQEAGAIGSPCLAQDIAPYKYFCQNTPALKWLLCENFEWEKKLCRLIEDTAFRQDLGVLMYHHTRTYFDIERTAQQWKDLSYSLV